MLTLCAGGVRLNSTPGATRPSSTPRCARSDLLGASFSRGLKPNLCVRCFPVFTHLEDITNIELFLLWAQDYIARGRRAASIKSLTISVGKTANKDKLADLSFLFTVAVRDIHGANVDLPLGWWRLTRRSSLGFNMYFTKVRFRQYCPPALEALEPQHQHHLPHPEQYQISFPQFHF